MLERPSCATFRILPRACRDHCAGFRAVARETGSRRASRAQQASAQAQARRKRYRSPEGTSPEAQTPGIRDHLRRRPHLFLARRKLAFARGNLSFQPFQVDDRLLRFSVDRIRGFRNLREHFNFGTAGTSMLVHSRGWPAARRARLPGELEPGCRLARCDRLAQPWFSIQGPQARAPVNGAERTCASRTQFFQPPASTPAEARVLSSSVDSAVESWKTRVVRGGLKYEMMGRATRRTLELGDGERSVGGLAWKLSPPDSTLEPFLRASQTRSQASSQYPPVPRATLWTLVRLERDHGRESMDSRAQTRKTSVHDTASASSFFSTSSSLRRAAI
ncbi:hypothetical protein C8R44DRAFT_866170 [Mycena epipterygia]|nr:hypothetical protein C8R44DRAFT_866170 [Mycena epipterygia]